MCRNKTHALDARLTPISKLNMLRAIRPFLHICALLCCFLTAHTAALAGVHNRVMLAKLEGVVLDLR